MGWRAKLVALGLLACAAAPAVSWSQQTAAPSITEHRIETDGTNIVYRAEAGLMPILADDGVLLGDMSYVAYFVPADETRPIAFIWNGGPGANTTPLHYGAFGPLRLDDGRLKESPATLLDVVDLVFVDQTETGFGRVAPGVDRKAMLGMETDAAAFARFIRNFLQEKEAHGRPVYLIGESYGVRRAALVADLLIRNGKPPAGLVLVSGYPLVGEALDATLEGALRVPGYAALAFALGRLAPSVGLTLMDVHDAARAWVLPIHAVSTATPDFMVGWQEFAEGLDRFTGTPVEDILGNRIGIGSSGAPYAFHTLTRKRIPALFSDIRSWDSYDVRHLDSETQSVWISHAVIDDLRKTLGFDLERDYVGQEYDMRVQSMPDNIVRLERSPDGSLKPVLGQSPAPPSFPFPPPGTLARSIANPNATWGSRQSTPDAMRKVMAAAPDMRVMIAGGIFDDIFPCAIGDEMASRDLAPFAGRVSSRCYPGGHMMYFEEAIGRVLSADVRDFVRADDGPAGTPPNLPAW